MPARLITFMLALLITSTLACSNSAQAPVPLSQTPVSQPTQTQPQTTKAIPSNPETLLPSTPEIPPQTTVQLPPTVQPQPQVQPEPQVDPTEAPPTVQAQPQVDPTQAPPEKVRSTIAGSQSPGTITIEDILENGLANVGASPVHLALRATPITDSTRCQWRGIARTMDQRADTIRMWFNLQPEDEILHPEYLTIIFDATMDTLQPDMSEILKSNFKSIATGGLSEEFLFLTCFTDHTVDEYILGSGPTTITVAYDNMDETPSYDLYVKAHGAGNYGAAPILSQTQHEAQMLSKLTTAEASLRSANGVQETILFLAPMAAHQAIAIEAWQSVAQWPLNEKEDSTLFITRQELPASEPDHEIPLADLKIRTTAAVATDDHADDRIANVSGLTQYYRDIGAYDDITPSDGSDTTFMPAMPPPIPTCTGSTAVGTDPGQGLVDDCNTLLDSKDTLAGTATLNWSKDLAMTSWDGLRMGGTPSRVQFILLTDQDLDGSIPAIFGDLDGLIRIDLDENDLSGPIPPQLGNLKELTHLYLFDNELTGAIPPELGHMTNLQILYLEDNALTGTIPQKLGDLSNLTQLILGDNQLSGTLPDEIGEIATLRHMFVRDNQLTGQIPRGLTNIPFTHLALSGNQFTGCLPTGMETANPQAHDLWRAELVALPSCGPDFSQENYTISVARASAAETTVGTTPATPWDTEGTVAYAIISGNDDGLFQMDQTTGEITFVRTPAGTDSASHTLTVQGTDEHGQEAYTTVTVTLTS